MNYLNHSLKSSIIKNVKQLQMVLKLSTSFEQVKHNTIKLILPTNHLPTYFNNAWCLSCGGKRILVVKLSSPI